MLLPASAQTLVRVYVAAWSKLKLNLSISSKSRFCDLKILTQVQLSQQHPPHPKMPIMPSPFQVLVVLPSINFAQKQFWLMIIPCHGSWKVWGDCLSRCALIMWERRVRGASVTMYSYELPSYLDTCLPWNGAFIVTFKVRTLNGTTLGTTATTCGKKNCNMLQLALPLPMIRAIHWTPSCRSIHYCLRQRQ